MSCLQISLCLITSVYLWPLQVQLLRQCSHEPFSLKGASQWQRVWMQWTCVEVSRLLSMLLLPTSRLRPRWSARLKRLPRYVLYFRFSVYKYSTNLICGTSWNCRDGEKTYITLYSLLGSTFSTMFWSSLLFSALPHFLNMKVLVLTMVQYIITVSIILQRSRWSLSAHCYPFRGHSMDS